MSNGIPLLSLIVPTINRSVELKKFLDSFLSQNFAEGFSYSDLELILVDQNLDQRVEELLVPAFDRVKVSHCREKKVSLSYAKNRGLDKAKGKFSFFPDDDCWLGAGFFESLLPALKQLSETEGVILKALTPQGAALVPGNLVAGFTLSTRNAHEAFYAPQIAQIYPTAAAKEVNGFNEKLGVGTEYGSAEDTDMLLRVVNVGVKFYFKESIEVFHPVVDYQTMPLQKSYEYGLGFGAFCRIHNWHAYWTWKLVRSLGGVITNSLRDRHKTSSYWKTLQGRWDGYWSYR